MSRANNVFKGSQFIIQERDARVIDSNERMAERIALLTSNIKDSMEELDEEGMDIDGFSEGLDAMQVSALLDDSSTVIKAEPVYEGPSAEEIIANANEEAEQILQNARMQADKIAEDAYEQANRRGHDEGYQRGYEEAQSLKEQCQQELEEKEAWLTNVYQEKIAEIEPELVDLITNIYEHVLNISLEDNKDVIIHLIENALVGSENSKSYLIHVSAEDLPYVSMKKEELMEIGGISNASLEIVEDMTLKKNQCMVETDGGIFDCSIGVELKELKKQLLILSYETKGEH